MKCLKCGAELTDDAKFCSYCGAIVKDINETSNSSIHTEGNETEEQEQKAEKQRYSSNGFYNNTKNSVNNETIINSILILWNKLSKFMQISIVSIILFILLCLFAFFEDKIFAGIIAIIEIALVIIAILTKKNANKIKKKRISIFALILSFVLIIPYIGLFKINTDDFFENKLSTYYNPLTTLDTLNWPESEKAKLIPIPKSKIGKIDKDNDKEFIVYVGETSVDEYNNYVAACEDKGFTLEAAKSDKHYSAKNKDSYRLSIDYKDKNVMFIILYEPEYSVNFEVDCVKNLIFSKYNVDIYVDDISEGTLEHGTSKSYNTTLLRGNHTIKFKSAEDDTITGEAKVNITKDETFKFEIYCSHGGIDVENISEQSIKEKDVKSESQSTDIDSEKITVSKGEKDFLGMNYTEAEKQLREMGFTKFDYKVIETEGNSKSNDTIGSIKVKTESSENEDFQKGNEYESDATVVISYYECKEVDSNITTGNNSDFAALMKITNQTDADTIKSFVNSHIGDTIEFDGCIALMMNHEKYKTRFDVCMSGGNYKADRVYGPLFAFENVSYYDMKVSGSDSVAEGMNFHVIAKIKGFKDSGCYILLEPTSLKAK